jgi:hypothetical protein
MILTSNVLTKAAITSNAVSRDGILDSDFLVYPAIPMRAVLRTSQIKRKTLYLPVLNNREIKVKYAEIDGN